MAVKPHRVVDGKFRSLDAIGRIRVIAHGSKRMVQVVETAARLPRRMTGERFRHTSKMA
jgi:hypothetical protein